MTSRMTIPLLALALCVSGVLGQAATGPVAGTPTPSQKPTFPYIGRIKGTDVYVRSGASTAYYFTTKLSAPARVTVTGHKYRWAQIIPPKGSFSWIYKNYVKLDPANPGIGMVTGDNVRVWAGSENVAPANSSSMQVQLNTGDLVKLLDAKPVGDYYKIEPPAGARLYVHLDYIEYVGPVPAIKPILPPRPGTTAPGTSQGTEAKPTTPPSTQEGPTPTKPTTPPAAGTESGTSAPITGTASQDSAAATTETQPTTPGTESTGPAATTPPTPAADASKETRYVEQCRQIEKQIKAELAKPLAQQDYSALREQLKAIQVDPAAGNAKVYAEYYLTRIEAYELVKQVTEKIQQNEQELATVRKKVEAELQAKLKAIPDRGRFLIRGRIKPSNIYTAKTGQKRYILLDESGRIVAYAVPATPVVDVSVKPLLNQVVGVVGQVISDPKNPVTLIRFTELEPIHETNEKTGTAESAPAKPATSESGGSSAPKMPLPPK